MSVKPLSLLVFLPPLTLVALPAIAAPEAPANIAEAYGKVPLQFEENRAGDAVAFLAHGLGYSLHLTSKEAVLVLAKPSEKAVYEPSEAVALRMSVVGARSATAITGVEELPGKANYFVGNDPSKWRTNVPTYAKARSSGVYPGIDLVYYGQQRQLEYDFIIAPGADPDQIKLGFTGANDLEIDAQGELVLQTAAGEVRQRKPIVYQEIDGVRRAIEGSYQRKGKHVGFKVGEYDHSRPLVIDPVIVFSTLLAGRASGVAVDAAGNVYVAGQRSGIIPTTPGALHTPLPEGAFVTKLDPSGSMVYSAYIGGAASVGNLAIDADGNAYLTGATNEVNFPTTPGALRTTWPATGLHAVFVTKLNASGSALVYSTYLGGSGTGHEQDDGLAIAVDADRNAYVTGITTVLDFPTTAGAFQTSRVAPILSQTTFVTKVNPTGSALVYSTYLSGSSGGTGTTIASHIAVDASGEAFVTGTTYEADFPTTAGAFRTGAVPDQFAPRGFITKFNSTGSALAYSTFFAGGAIAVDAPGHAYVLGGSSPDSPTTPGAFQLEGNGGADVYVAKLDVSGSALVYGTFLGGTGNETGYAIAIDAEGNAFVTGTTNSTDFPTTQDACQIAFRGDVDTFVTMLDPNGSKVVYSTYLGGPEEDIPAAIAVDTGGTAYVVGNTRPTVEHCPQGATHCPDDFPTTAGALQATFDGFSGGDGFVVKVAEPVLPAASPPATSSATGTPAQMPSAATQVADSGSQSSGSGGGGGAFDWFTLSALLAAVGLVRRRRAEG